MSLAAGSPDGPKADIAGVPSMPRAAGKRLSEAGVRQVSDLVRAFLLEGLGLSPADAERVLARQVKRRQAECRMKQLRPLVRRYGIYWVLSRFAPGGMPADDPVRGLGRAG